MKIALPWAMLCAVGLAAPAPATAQPVTYVLDPAHSWVHFEVLHFGTSTSRGRIGPLVGSVTLDRTAGLGEADVRAPTGSVATGLAVFDARLRQPDLLGSDAHPEAYFVARGFRLEGGRVTQLQGEFTLRGTSQPLTLRARQFGCHRAADREVCGGDFEAEVLRSDFGMTFGLPFVADRVRLVVQVEGVRR